MASRKIRLPSFREFMDDVRNIGRTRDRWHVFGQSVTGASHKHTGKTNQDHIDWTGGADTGLPIILAVADGHGSSIRGEIGAKMAVETAIDVLGTFCMQSFDPETWPATRRMAKERLPREIALGWRQSVETHIEQTPFTVDEREALKGTGENPLPASLDEEAALATYGSTILTVFVAQEGKSRSADPTYVIGYLQLGDGDIMTVSDEGEVKRPVSKDERLIGNETTSLVMAQAWNSFSVEMSLSDRVPALILVSTDGYANSFIDETGFHQVGSDILDFIRTDGLDMVKSNLESWLEEATYAGSGDDVTLGIVYREGAVSKRA